MASLLVSSIAICFAFGVLAADLPPHLLNLTQLAEDMPEVVLHEIRNSPLRAVVREVGMPETVAIGSALPTVTAHGMGDSCWEPGFGSVTRGIAKKTGSYAVCVPTAGNFITDTIAGFLKNMDKSLDYFAAKIRADPKLAGGFNAIGFSQGNSLIRGYIQKYNDPPVNAFISVHGTVMGVAAIPSCFQQEKPLGLICKAVAEVLGDFAYLGIAQDVLFQADYYRDPMKVTSKEYLKNSQIGQWNNENPATKNATYASNFAKTKRFAMVKALKDTMVYPNEGEWWGQMDDGSYTKPALTMKETKFYKQDLFGLKTADEAGKIVFETTPGDHLQFTEEELYGWVQKYFMNGSAHAEPAITQAIVDEVNTKQTSWTAHMSPRFANATLSDIKSLCGTFLKGHPQYSDSLDEKETDEAWVLPEAIPSSFDVRTQWPKCASVSGHIRDQSACGSCWAFGSTEAFNDRRCVATSDTTLLSPEDTVSNCGLLKCMSMGCGGGQPGRAWAWFASTGVVTGGDYDDIGKGDTCAPYSLAPCAHHVNGSKYPACPSKEYSTPHIGSSCTEKKYAKSYSADKKKASSSYGLGSVEKIQQDMLQHGSVTAAFTVYSDFPAYQSGVYHHTTGSMLGGHAIRILGWGTQDGDDYWIVANSWNENWGDHGTFKIKRGTNECGIEGQVSAGTVSASDDTIII